jgi:ATP-dependent protease ClpP protease subunit
MLVVLLAASVCASAALMFFRFEILDLFLWIGKTVTTGGFLALIAAALTLSTFTLAFVSWKSLKASGPSVGLGLVFLFCAATTALQGCVAISMYLTSSDTSSTYAAMSDMESAEVYLIEPGHVFVDGTIGASFFADMMSNHSDKEPIKTIEINSGGGLVDQAMKLADFIEKQKITVVVGERCLSACVIVAVASPDLTAHESSIFGFHQSAPVAETTSQLFKLGFKSIYADSNKFLSDHGVPADIMKQAEAHKPEQMYEVKAADMMKAGVVKKVIPDEKIDEEDTAN